MNDSRRTFLKTSALTIAATAIGSRYLFAVGKKNDTLGLQLYSVRDDMAKDPIGTLKQLSAMGYKYVEHAGYSDRKFYGIPAKEFKTHLDDLGLIMCSGHVQLTMNDWDAAKGDFTDKWKYTMEDARTAGQRFLINPWMDESLRKDYEGLLHFLDLFNKCGAICKKYGLRYGYHNHDFEFKTSFHGKKIFDIIVEKIDPSLVALQLDIGNMYGAGGRGLEILKKYPGRFELMHVKDEIKSDKGEMNDGYESTVLGQGILPVKQIIDYARQNGGTSYFIVEQESYQGKTPIECAKDDLKVMKKWGF